MRTVRARGRAHAATQAAAVLASSGSRHPKTAGGRLPAMDEIFLLPVAGKCVNFDNSDRFSRKEKLKSFGSGYQAITHFFSVHCFEASSA